jgi:acyl-CoA reductase-like NAD-dependent aldehyde dehydrogenase
MALRSYVSGSWTSPADEGQPLLDAVTGAEVAKVSAVGIDMNGVLEHGRAVGGPALRELTFHQRAALLKSLGSLLREQRDELYALSARTGATLNDSKFDIDGGIGVLFSYASKGRRELPDDRVLVEGEVEQLSKAGHLVGQHILSPLRGVAVQVNAFNFPVWGPLEKFAPAFLAGVPSVVKPASATAYLTHRLVELIVASGLLPEGALQLIAGGVGSLFDYLTDQDLVWFTGSASTATRLRTNPTVVARSVRFNAEADSLNCSVLGPDAQPGTPEFDLFVKQLVTEMVGEAASERLAKVIVGNPSNPSVRMGALASLEQREEVRRSLKGLFAAAAVVFGDPEHVEVIDADPSAARSSHRSCCELTRIAPSHMRSKPSARSAPCWATVTPTMRLPLLPAVLAVSQARSSPTTPSLPARWCWVSPPGTAGCWCSTVTTRRSPPGTGPRCRCWCTAGLDAPAAARSWAVSGRSPTTCSAPQCRPAPGCWRQSRTAGCRELRVTPKARTPSASR